MSESISQFSAIELPGHIAKEFSIDGKTGQGFVTRKGLARLCGVTRQSVQQLLSAIAQCKQSLPKNLKPFAGQDFTGGNQIPDVLVAGVG
ncbi:MAG: hypothetical protein VKL42_04975 [Snowella sp.]|nr:hypothetical protein [Snowella sp.]